MSDQQGPTGGITPLDVDEAVSGALRGLSEWHDTMVKLNTRLSTAVANRQWAAAATLAERVAQINIDMAQRVAGLAGRLHAQENGGLG